MGRMVVASPHVRFVSLFFLPTLAAHHEHVSNQIWTVVQVEQCSCTRRCLGFIRRRTEGKDIVEAIWSTSLILRIASLVVDAIDYVASQVWMLLRCPLKGSALALSHRVCCRVEATRSSTVLQTLAPDGTMLVRRCQHDTLAVVPSLGGSCWCRIEIKEAAIKATIALFSSHLGAGCSWGCECFDCPIGYCSDAITALVIRSHLTCASCLLLRLVKGHAAHKSTLGSFDLIQDVSLIAADHLDREHFRTVRPDSEWITARTFIVLTIMIRAHGSYWTVHHDTGRVLLELRFKVIFCRVAAATVQRDL